MPLPSATLYKVLLGGTLTLGLADLAALNLFVAPDYFAASDSNAATTSTSPPARVPSATVSVALVPDKPPVRPTPTDIATASATGTAAATATASQPSAVPVATTAAAPTATAPVAAVVAASPPTAVENIYFDRGSSRIGPDAQAALAAAVREMKAKPDLRVTIKGHADEVGSADFNNWLSLKRAESAAGALRGAGIDGRRIEVKGMGMTEPLDPSHTEQAFAKNRRVEFAWIMREPTR
jgi:peptidoglycan-associated lipoprotein